MKKKITFQSPEGDSLFFYWGSWRYPASLTIVSVPRRGFVVFLLGWVGYTWSTLFVSVPRRGFVVFLLATGNHRWGEK